MKASIILAFLLSSLVLSQDLDSLFNEFVNMAPSSAGEERFQGVSEHPGKCGFWVAAQIAINFEQFSDGQKAALRKILDRIQTDKTIISPSGIFRIHYDTSGINAPDFNDDGIPDTDLSWLLLSADSVYDFEVNTLGYTPPPGDGTEGGDSKYDIYIQNIGDYGYTQPETSVGNGKWTSYMVIDNDFQHTYSKGTSGARVTIAHEFHHAIQIGGYFLRDEDRFYYEITSTAMEEFMYDNINDYYNYMGNYFYGPDKKALTRMSTGLDGYDLAVWNIFLADRFGMDLLRRIWELMPEYRAMNAISTALVERGSTFKQELLRFASYTYFTGNRAKAGEYFEEAVNYPLVRPVEKIDGLSGRSLNSVSASNMFIEYYYNNNGFTDTLTAIVSNSDIEGSLKDNAVITPLEFNISEEEFENSHRLSDQLNIYASVTSNSQAVFSEAYIYNNEPVEFFFRSQDNFPFPQPFSYKAASQIFLPVEPGSTLQADLYIYTISMNLVYNGPATINNTGNVGIYYNMLNNDKKKLTSGIYVYVIKNGDNITKGKFAVINE